nr:MarR family transcriptional regulator [Halorubrum salsamenti]
MSHYSIEDIIKENYVVAGMGNGSKTGLQRDILLTWWENPNATNQEIADACDCSASYVSQIKNRFDDYNELDAMMDRQDSELERMFGEGIFGNNGTTPAAVETEGPGIAEQWNEIPNNIPGLLIKLIVVMVLGYAAIQVGMTLFL